MSEGDDKFTDAETQRRLDAALAKSLKMKPKPHNSKKAKAKPHAGATKGKKPL